MIHRYSSHESLVVGWHSGRALWSKFEPLPADGVVGPGVLCIARKGSFGEDLGLDISIRVHPEHGRIGFPFVGRDQSIELDRSLHGRVSKRTVTGADLCEAVNNVLSQQGIPFGRS